jgi:uncharacterized protein HemY
VIERLLAADAALDRGEPDVAERLYRQVADADPRNAIAVVGLARVAAARGDAGAARALAERALTIDAEEAAARRLLDSLAIPAAPTAAAPAEAAEPTPPPPGRQRGFWGFVRRQLRRR